MRHWHYRVISYRWDLVSQVPNPDPFLYLIWGTSKQYPTKDSCQAAMKGVSLPVEDAEVRLLGCEAEPCKM